MKPFSYLTPTGPEEVVRLLVEHGSAAQVLAGGQSLLLALKDRSARPSVLVSLESVGLGGVCLADTGELVVGATTTYAALTTATLTGWHRVVAEMAGDLADRPVRTMGTIGGALCSGDPRYDMLALAVGTGAVLEVLSPDGVRLVAAEAFFRPTGGTVLGGDELLLAVRFPPVARFTAVAFEKFRRRTFDAALVSSFVALSVAGGSVAGSRITVGAAVPAPVPAVHTAAALVGSPLPAVEAAAVARATADEVLGVPGAEPPLRQYQRQLVHALTRTALTRAVDHSRS